MPFDLSQLSTLTTEVLRQALSPVAQHHTNLDDEGVTTETFTAAAVLFPLIPRPSGFTALFTRRTEHLRDHAGQISFPGGRSEETDRSPQDTALREATEEIGLARDRSKILGFLPDYRTITGYSVTPVVSAIYLPFSVQPDTNEVAEVFEVPLAFLLNPANQQRHTCDYHGQQRTYWAIPYGDFYIWGATAGIIVSLTKALQNA